MALTPEDIAEKEFSLGLRGYDKDEVRSYLQTVADDLREVIGSATAPAADEASAPEVVAEQVATTPARSTKAAAKAKAAPAGTSVATDAVAADAGVPDWSNLGEEIASVLRTAHEQANGLRADAVAQAAAIRDEAQKDATAARAAADQDRADAAAALEKAQGEALDLVAQAQARIDDRLAKAKEAASRDAAASVAELTEQIGELTTTRDDVRSELAMLRSRLDDTLAATAGETVSTS